MILYNMYMYIYIYIYVLVYFKRWGFEFFSRLGFHSPGVENSPAAGVVQQRLGQSQLRLDASAPVRCQLEGFAGAQRFSLVGILVGI